MNSFVPYHISHIQLQSEELKPQDLRTDIGNYIVFWWKHYPLGHMFLKPGKSFRPDDLLSKTVISIKDSLHYYAELKGVVSSFFNDKAQLSWALLRAHLEELFGSEQADNRGKVNLSVIICTRNRSQYIGDCLNSLLSMKVLPQEIIVVDNAPSDDQTKLAVQAYPGIIYALEPRPGLDVARNKGIEVATCEFIAYVDDDVKVHPLWAQQVVDTFTDSSIGGMTGLVFASQLDTEAQVIFETHWSFNRGFRTKDFTPEMVSRKGRRPPPVWEIGAGANMAFRRSIFETTGVFDDRLDAGAAGCSGDSEMWFRVLLHGYTMRYNPLAVVHHEHRRDMKDLKKQIFNYMRGFATAALIQHKQKGDLGYLKHMLTRMPYYYLRLAMRGFPRYSFRFRTLFQEITGLYSGFYYYWQNRKP